MSIEEKENLKDQIKKKKKEGWIEAWMAIEALAIDKKVVEESLKKHIGQLNEVKDILVFEEKFGEIKHVENPMKDVKEGYAQIVEIKFFAKTFTMLLNAVMTYGPSAIEIVGPNKKEIDISEMQNVANTLAGVVHQFAAAGVGGIVITPK